MTLLVVVLVAGVYWQKNQQRSPATPQVLAVSVNSEGRCKPVRVDPNDDQAYLPDHNCTPGVIDSTVTQENIMNTICRSGYTATVRPAVTYTNDLKRQQISDYGYTDMNMKNYEEDHLISLELGGSPSDPRNLWPEPHPSFNEKDKVENYLHDQVCSGKISLLEAQKEISGNWYQVFQEIR